VHRASSAFCLISIYWKSVLRAGYSEIKQSLATLFFEKLKEELQQNIWDIYISARLSFICILSPSHKSAMKATLIYE